MQSSLISLEAIEIASPCRADWDAMQGNQCVRFCPSCGKNVYNLSAMTREEAERLITRKEGTPCVRLRRRSDGTVLTDDCPIGSQTRKRHRGIAQLFAAALAGVTALFGLRGALVVSSPDAQQTNSPETFVGVPAPAWKPSPPAENVPSPVDTTKNALGVGEPSSVTAEANASGQTQIIMGDPGPFNSDLIPTPTPPPKHGKGARRT